MPEVSEYGGYAGAHAQAHMCEAPCVFMVRKGRGAEGPGIARKEDISSLSSYPLTSLSE